MTLAQLMKGLQHFTLKDDTECFLVERREDCLLAWIINTNQSYTLKTVSFDLVEEDVLSGLK